MAQSINRNDLRCTAFHEAGHAVAAALNGIPFERVFVVLDVDHASRPLGMVIGQVVRNFHKPDLAGKGEEEARRQVLMAFAGPFGQTLAYPGLLVDLAPGQNDFEDAISILRFTFCAFKMDGEKATFTEAEQLRNRPVMERMLKEAAQLAERFRREHARQITQVAEALLQKGELTYDEVVTLCQG